MIRILLVEDHPVLLAGLKTALGREEGFELAGEATTGEETLRLVRENKSGPIDVVVMDIGLPGQSGIETTRHLKQEFPDLRVLMYTVHQLEEEIFRSFSSGADGYCLKDTTIDSLVLGIRAVSLGSLYIDPKIAHIAVQRIFSVTRSEESPLTPRETEILKLLADGQSNKDIARQADISLSTVKAHIQSILSKLEASSRADAAVKALRKGLI